MNTTQTVLLGVVIALAIFLLALGFQAFFVLRDVRKTLARVNRLLDEADNFIVQTKKPLESVGNFITALTAGAGLAHLLKRGREDKK